MKNTYVFSLGAAIMMAAILPATLSATPVKGEASGVNAVAVESAAAVWPAKPGTDVYVPEDARETIDRIYPDAKGLAWGSEADVYTAYFREPFSKVVASVDGEGNLLNVLTYYDQGQMPMRVRALLKEKFPDKMVKFVTRSEQEGGELENNVPDITFQATLEDATHWYVVTISGDQITSKKVLLKA